MGSTLSIFKQQLIPDVGLTAENTSSPVKIDRKLEAMKTHGVSN